MGIPLRRAAQPAWHFQPPPPPPAHPGQAQSTFPVHTGVGFRAFNAPLLEAMPRPPSVAKPGIRHSVTRIYSICAVGSLFLALGSFLNLEDPD